jgi:hypothetical protein
MTEAIKAKQQATELEKSSSGPPTVARAGDGVKVSLHRTPCAVRWYFRFQLSLRDIEELLIERGVIVTYAPKEVQ